MSPRLRAELRHLGLAWCILASAAATLGGLAGWVTWERSE